MKKLFVFSAITVSSLISSVALADEPVYPPCNGNFGITYPNRCTPQPPTPEIPDEAFAAAPDVVIEVAPMEAPAPIAAEAPEAPCVDADPQALANPFLLHGGTTQGRSGLFSNTARVREVGFRSFSGDGETGGSLYLRTHRKESRVGLEFSLDGMGAVVLSQASLVGYSKHQGAVRSYAFVGGGAYVAIPGLSFQTGVGVDINLTQRLTLNLDARYLVADEINKPTYLAETSCFDCFSSQSFDGGLVGVGLGWKFGALGKQEKTVFQGKLSGRSTSWWPSQSKYTYSQRWNQSRTPSQSVPLSQLWNQPSAGWNQSKYVAAWNQPKTPGQSTSRLGMGSPSFVREVGVRSFSDLGDGGNDTGGGLYFQTYRDGGRLGGEVSLDAIGSETLVQGSLLGYLNPKGSVRPYGIFGVGTNVSTGELNAQWGAGVDVAVSKHFSVTGDLRGLEGAGTYGGFECDANGVCSNSTFEYLSATVGAIGVGYKF